MSNPFDEFDQAGGNPFDEFDGAPAKRKKPTASKGERFLKGMQDPIDGGAQLLERVMPEKARNAVNQFNNWLAAKTGLVAPVGAQGVSADIAAREREYQERAPEGVDGMRILGNIASPANLALAARGATTVGGAARVGAASAAMNPVGNDEDFWGEKGKQAAIGAAGGAAFQAGGRALSRAALPRNTTNPDLQLLRREGVEPTIGQTLGGGWNRFEQKATSIPFVGDGIFNARTRARDQFNVAGINRATGPVGVRIDEPGHAGVGRAQRALEHAYDDAGNAMGAFRLDRQGVRDWRTLRGMVRSLPENEQRMFGNIERRATSEMGPRGQLLPDAFKRTDSYLGAQSRNYAGTTDAYQRQLGDAVDEFQRIIRETGQRQNPAARALYENADRGYANLTRVEAAANAGSLTGGTYTPGQLLTAARQGDSAVRHRANARGESLMQDLGVAGQRVLGNTIPDSGTAGRLATPGVLGLGGATGAGWIEPTTAITTALGFGLGRAAYTEAGQRLLRALVSSRPGSPAYRAAANGLREIAQHTAPAGAQTGLGFFDGEE